MVCDYRYSNQSQGQQVRRTAANRVIECGQPQKTNIILMGCLCFLASYILFKSLLKVSRASAAAAGLVLLSQIEQELRRKCSEEVGCAVWWAAASGLLFCIRLGAMPAR